MLAVGDRVQVRQTGCFTGGMVGNVVGTEAGKYLVRLDAYLYDDGDECHLFRADDLERVS